MTAVTALPVALLDVYYVDYYDDLYNDLAGQWPERLEEILKRRLEVRLVTNSEYVPTVLMFRDGSTEYVVFSWPEDNTYMAFRGLAEYLRFEKQETADIRDHLDIVVTGRGMCPFRVPPE